MSENIFKGKDVELDEQTLEKIKEAKDKMYKETLLNNKYSKRK